MFHVGRPIAAVYRNGDRMKLGRCRAALIPALAAAAVTLGLPAGTAAAATSHSVPRPARVTAPRPVRVTAPLPVAFNCWRAHVRPRNLYIACADGNNYLTRLSWSAWSRTFASGTGTQMINNCIPYCAAGRFFSYPVDVVFWRSEPIPHHPGEKYFSRVTLLYPGARPPAFYRGKQNSGPETWTGILPSN